MWDGVLGADGARFPGVRGLRKTVRRNPRIAESEDFVKSAIDKVGYRGFSARRNARGGDSREKVPKLIRQIRTVFGLP
jgi:hypothetical protein